MKKIALAAFSATAMLALSACGDAAEEAPVEETTVIDTAPVEPIVDDTAAMDAGATDAMSDAATDAAAGADAAADAAADSADSAADAADAAAQ